MYLDFVGDLDELYAACRIGYDVNAPHGMALIAEIQRQDSLIGALQADNMRLRGLIAEAVEDMGRGGMCIHAGLKGRMVQAMTPNARAPTLEDFCDAANDLYAAPTEERFHAVVNLARESLILRGQAWDEGFAFGTSGQRDELARLRQQLAAARLALVQYGAHDGACSVCDLDDEGRHCACDCGYEAAIKAAEDKAHKAQDAGIERKIREGLSG